MTDEEYFLMIVAGLVFAVALVVALAFVIDRAIAMAGRRK